MNTRSCYGYRTSWVLWSRYCVRRRLLSRHDHRRYDWRWRDWCACCQDSTEINRLPFRNQLYMSCLSFPSIWIPESQYSTTPCIWPWLCCCNCPSKSHHRQRRTSRPDPKQHTSWSRRLAWKTSSRSGFRDRLSSSSCLRPRGFRHSSTKFWTSNQNGLPCLVLVTVCTQLLARYRCKPV